MLVETPIANIFDPDSQDISAWSIDWVDFSWMECASRAVRKQSRNGQDIRILLKLGVTLRHGDVLWRSEDRSDAIVVSVELSNVLIARPRNSVEAISLAFELGNLHVPIEVSDDGIVTVDDGPVEAVFRKLGVPYELQSRRFEPPLRGTGQFALSDKFEISRKS
ncbi:MAG TPA: hypothetical protein VHD56_02255 [Tepidisphaeraceae bacterium]|nr:hypothetical protein [Tepidisphaeraceae bacterium]